MYKRVTIQGFDVGLDVGHGEYSMVFEHLKLQNQKVAGIRNNGNVLSIRDLQCTQSDPLAVAIGSMIVLLESTLRRGKATGVDAKGPPAIRNAGKLFLRDVIQGGYASLVQGHGSRAANLPGEKVAEWSSNGTYHLFTQKDPKTGMLRLEIKETPEPAWGKPEDWVVVVDYMVPNAVQAVFDKAVAEGKAGVMFSPGVGMGECHQSDDPRAWQCAAGATLLSGLDSSSRSTRKNIHCRWRSMMARV